MAVDNDISENDSTSVHVAVRVRPQSAKEKLAMSQICATVAPNAPQIILGKDSCFTFDCVFNINSNQEQIFQTLAKPLIDGCMSGYNATILAYGQTGSGKTYTMGTGFDFGSPNLDAGIIPRAVQYLFSKISQCRSQAAAKHEPVPEFKVVAQFLELYNEELVDLLDSDKSRKSHLRLHENAQGDIYLTGVSTRLVSSLDDTLKCLRDGSLVRSTASTNMNAQSSRSHAIFTLHIRQQRLVKYDEDAAPSKPDDHPHTEQDPDSTVIDPVPEFETLTAKFHFVDLAGSERLKRTGATGDRAKEGISINRGLLALGNVISALGDKAKRGCHVPYRDSKLTRLLQDSLGGNSRTIMIACISPSDCDFVETLNTLKYANRARNIRNRVVMNQDKTSKQLAMLRAQLAALQEEVDEYRQGKRIATAVGTDGVSDLSKEIAFWRAENDKLHLRVKALTVTVDTLKARNAYLVADQEASSWAASKAKLLVAAQGDTSADANVNDTRSSASAMSVIVEEMDSFRELVEKYTMENEELRTKLAEAEALAEFGQRPFTFASPFHPSHLADGSSNRVALTNNEFPDLDTSIVAAAEAGLSAASFYLDEEDADPLSLASASQPHRHRRHHRRHKKHQKKKEHLSEIQDNPESIDRKPLNDVTPNGSSAKAWASNVEEHKRQRLLEPKRYEKEKVNGDELADLTSQTYSELDEDAANSISMAEDGVEDDPYNNLTIETEESEALNVTLLASHTETNAYTPSSRTKRPSGSADDTLSDASDVGSAGSSESDTSESDGDNKDGNQPARNENEAKLHRSLAHISSQIDSKQQRERDTVMANIGQLEHTGEERLRRTREEFEKRLACLQEEVKHLQHSRQDQLRLEREQAKKNGELRQLRAELEELRRYKVDLTKRLQEETKRTRQLEAVTAKRLMELKRAKSQADSQIRSLEAAHSAKERALRQKQAELEVLKRKTLEQQRQLSSSANRMTQSFVGAPGSSWNAVGKTQRAIGRNVMSASMHADTQSATGRMGLSTARGRLVANAKAKWVLVMQQLEMEVQRRQTSARLEHDLQTWLRERDCLGRRLQRLQRRRARVEESVPDDPEQEDFSSRLAAFDEQIRNITAQLDSVQEAIRECQASIIELDKSGSKVTTSISTTGPKLSNITSMSTQLLFSHCTLAESRFLLNQLYAQIVSRTLQISRLEQNEAQLRANLSVWEQEREQELEVLRLAMRHAGLPLDSVDNVLSVANNSERSEKTTAFACPRHGSATVATCECCSVMGLASSAPPSSEDSSDEGEQSENRTLPDHRFGPVMGLMSQSMYATLDVGNSRKTVRRNLSENEELSSSKLEGCTDMISRTTKARGRMLLPQDMLGLSSSQVVPGSDSVTASDLMPPPGSYFLRRPRTAQNQSVVSRTTPVSSSAGPSPVIRRRIPPGQPSTLPTTTGSAQSGPRLALSSLHSVPVSMSMSLTLPCPSTTNSEIQEVSSTETKSGPAVSACLIHLIPAAGPFSRSKSIPLPPLALSSYRLASSTAPTATAAPLTVSANDTPVATSIQPLAAFFTNLSAQPQIGCTVVPSSVPISAPPIVQSTQSNTSFRVPMECTHVARGHSNGVLDVDIVGTLMVTGSKDRTAKVWDLNTMEEVDTLRDHLNNVSKVRMCPVTGLIFTVCSYFVKVWDRRDARKCIRTLLSSGLSQDGEQEIKVTRRQNICPPGETNIMDVALGGPHLSLTHSMFLATANSVRLWDLRRYYSVGKLHGNHQAPVMVLAAGQTPVTSSPAEPQLTVVTGSKDHYIKVFHVGPHASGLLTPALDLEPPHYDGIESLALHNNILFSGSRDAAIKKWNLARDGRQEVMLAQAHKDWIQGLAITQDGMNLISGCRGGNLKLWNVEDCTCLGEVLNAHDGAINAVRAYEDRIFTAGSDKDVRFWKLLDHVRR
ncbi:hypothetical protein EG68_09166 [Paragonimus skrjabini miyazakii]|uniref:Kinesin motor domain-containing protein n=1 Tax=Paragonimus skrjabini miyazakii TaxID=59628 RepID=A0A8S9YF76_9TREM|nr:hypothetical protein EG68_09166 [Paragonimus skrjabini miyazakii]